MTTKRFPLIDDIDKLRKEAVDLEGIKLQRIIQGILVILREICVRVFYPSSDEWK
jgi:hypothetical protein